MRFIPLLCIGLLLAIQPGRAFAACTSPAGVAGQIAIVGGVVKSCDGTNWAALGGSSQWTTSGSDIYYSTGNVSIGTSTPTQALTLNGNLGIVGTSRRILGDFSNATHASRTMLQTSTANGSSIVGIIPSGTGASTGVNIYNNSDATQALAVGQFASTTASTYINSSVLNGGTQLPLTFSIGNVEKMRVDTAGNIGIGTTAANPLNASSTLYGNVVTIANATAGARALLELWTNAAPTTNQAIGQINFISGSYATVSGSSSAAAITSISNGTVANTGNLGFWTSAANGSITQRMTVSAGGNVGINTGSPAYTLEIANSVSNPSLGMHYTGAAAASARGTFYFTHNRSSDSTQELLSYIQGIAENNQSNGGMRFMSRTGSGDVEVMRMFSTGDLSVGTASDGYRLNVQGASGQYAGYFADSTGQAQSYITHSSLWYSVWAGNSGSGLIGVLGYVTGGGSATGVNALSTNSASYGALGSNNPTGYYCYISWQGYALICNGPSAGISDQRLKKDIKPLEEGEGVAAIMKIEPVHFRWKDEKMNVLHPQGEIGFTAQNVEVALPVLVSDTKQTKEASIKLEGGTQKSLQYERLTAPLVKAVQQLKNSLDSQDKDLTELEAYDQKLSAEFAAYKTAHP